MKGVTMSDIERIDDPRVKRMVLWIAAPMLVAVAWMLLIGRSAGVLAILVIGEIIAAVMVVKELNASTEQERLDAVVRRQRYQAQRRSEVEAVDRIERQTHAQSETPP